MVVFVIGFASLCVALPPPPPSGGTPDCWPPPCIPIDGGISLLVAAGAIYGGRKLYKNQQEKICYNIQPSLVCGGFFIYVR